MSILIKVKNLLRTKRRKLTAFIILPFLLISVWKLFGNNSPKVSYQTAQVERGTLISTISASGDISTVGNINITTQASGTVNKVYVQNGDKVGKGQKIADIILDSDSQQKSTAAYASYLSAKNSVDSAQTSLFSLDSAMWAAQRAFMNDAVSRGLAVDDPTYIQENDNWQAAQAKYISQKNIITQSQVSLSNAWLTYQQLSPNISAPVSGTINNLIIAPGLVLTNQSSSSTSTSSLNLGTMTTPMGHTQATVNLSEIDAPKVKQGQKVTLTLDALPDKTFTGKVLVIDTNGSVSSGVTTYPATIDFDTTTSDIYPNMGVNADIMTNVKTDVLLVPSSAIQTSNGQSTVRILKNNQPQSVPVEIGSSNDTQTEIVSGVNEGDTVITSVIQSTAVNGSSSTSSPFGGLNRGFGGAVGGGAVRINRGN